MGRALPSTVTILLLTATALLLTATCASAWQEGLAPRLDKDSGAFDVRVTFASDRDAFTVEGRRLLLGSQEVYLASADVVSIFRASRFWDPELNRLTLRVGDRQLVTTAGSRLYMKDERAFLLPVPVLVLDGDFWLPMEFVVNQVGPVLGETAAWNRAGLILHVGAAKPNVTGLTVETGARSTTLRVLCEEPLGWRATGPASGVVTLKIYGGIVDRRSVRLGGPRGLITGVTSRQRSDHALIDVEIRSLVRHSHARSGGDGREIVLVLEETETSALPDLEPRGALNMSGPLELGAGTRAVRTIVIDPGHGGDDTGRVGPSGVREKDVVLDLARRLEDELEDRGYVVVLTRDGDEDPAPDARAEIANRSGGDLFLSLHANGWFDRQVRGVETHLLMPSGTGDDTAGGGDFFVAWPHVQWRHLGASREAADLVQARLVDGAAALNRGVRSTAQRVLRGVDMPALVVEVGYLTHPGEEKQLDSGSYRERLADSLARAVDDYRDLVGRYLAQDEEERR